MTSPPVSSKSDRNPAEVNHRKRIGLVAANLGGGGAERSLVNLASGFVEKGYEVEFVLFQTGGANFDQIPEGSKVIELGVSHAWQSLPKLMNYLNTSRPDAVLSILDQVNVAVMMAKRLTHVPSKVCVAIHSTLSKEIASMGRKKKLEMWLASKLYPRAHKVITVSEGAADDAAKLLGINRSHFAVLMNPVITQPILNLYKNPPEHPWLTNRTTPIVLAVGRLTLAKDFDILIKAFSKVANNCNARLIIFGEGELREKLENIVKDLNLGERVSMPGFTKNPYAEMHASDVFVLSSRFEGLPGVLIEAMASGASLVSTDCESGPREILEGGKWGRLIPVGDSESIADAILEALKEKESGQQVKIPDETLARYGYLEATQKYLEVLFGD